MRAQYSMHDRLLSSSPKALLLMRYASPPSQLQQGTVVGDLLCMKALAKAFRKLHRD